METPLPWTAHWSTRFKPMNLVNMIVFESMRPKLAKRKVKKNKQYFFTHTFGGGAEIPPWLRHWLHWRR